MNKTSLVYWWFGTLPWIHLRNPKIFLWLCSSFNS